MSACNLEERPFYDPSYMDLLNGSLAPHVASEAEFAFIETQVLRPLGQPLALDHGCGFGLYLVPLAHRGWSISGLDLHGPFLDHAREALGFQGPLIQADAHTYVAPEHYDAVLSLGATFTCFSREEAPGVLRCIYESLRPSGSLLLHLGSPVYARKYMRGQVWWEGGNGMQVLEQRDYSEPGHWTVLHRRFRPDGDGRWTGTLHRARMTSFRHEEILALVQDGGFEVIQTWGDFQGGPVGDDRPYLIYHCRRA